MAHPPKRLEFRAGGRRYVLTRDGETLAFRTSPKYELLATDRPSPGEPTNSSLAVSDGESFIRIFRHLWCVSEKK